MNQDSRKLRVLYTLNALFQVTNSILSYLTAGTVQDQSLVYCLDSLERESMQRRLEEVN